MRLAYDRIPAVIEFYGQSDEQDGKKARAVGPRQERMGWPATVAQPWFHDGVIQQSLDQGWPGGLLRRTLSLGADSRRFRRWEGGMLTISQMTSLLASFADSPCLSSPLYTYTYIR